MFEKNSSAGYLANHMARLFANGLHKRIARFGLAPAQFMALLELWVEDGLTQSELVERLDVEQATLANTLKRMERDGLIERHPHPSDKRALQNWVTPHARSLQGPATRAAQEQNELALDGLSKEEKTLFLRFARQIIQNMQRG